MSWLVDRRVVAEATGATVSGASIAGGAHVHVDVSFRLVEWPWNEKGPVSLIPQPSEVTARAQGREVPIGFALPTPQGIINPLSHSSTANVRFTLALTMQALNALEAFRDGRSLELGMMLVAHPLLVFQSRETAPGIDVRPTAFGYVFKVPTEQWTEVLRSVGYCDTLVTELRIPTSGPDSTARGRQRLTQAVDSRNDGSYAESVRRCRIALDELKTAGFGGRAPDEVAKFLQKNAGTLSPAERFSALKVALRLFLSPAHHANSPEEEYTREDADVAIAMTAVLLRLAPARTTEPTE